MVDPPPPRHPARAWGTAIRSPWATANGTSPATITRDLIRAGLHATAPATVPEGKAPVFLKEHTVRFVRECCAIADVDPDEWVEGWIGSQVSDALDGKHRVSLAGICADLVEDHGKRTPKEKTALYRRLEEVAKRYQQEEAAA